ncbi:hypothetical protein [Mangrovibrevibacter kandeliae]|uniref:hypothetical protein n=1 Tax=Mangrovibrevibacter kandeliae TaxID=2968473 RepID=UPI0021179BF2|nr:hypothetical protein [Aurantimonas sp. CSK15Z-1]MCQ8783135.1 hypothetical protein [Aurantimonas sp. CSK15Z-1]
MSEIGRPRPDTDVNTSIGSINDAGEEGLHQPVEPSLPDAAAGADQLVDEVLENPDGNVEGDETGIERSAQSHQQADLA